MTRTRMLGLAVGLLAVVTAGWQRARAVERLPPDFDEFSYVPAAYAYAKRAGAGDWKGVATYDYNTEHPPLVKLTYAAALSAAGAPEPDWDALQVGRPIPPAARPAFDATRWPNALAGIAQVALVATVHPAGALLLALDVYHAKYTAQAYLEALPGLFVLLAVLAFERSRRPAGTLGGRAGFSAGGLAVAGALLGLAAGGKYAYGVTALAFLPFLVRERAGWRGWLALGGATVAAFVLVNPALWVDPVGRITESVVYHFKYSQSEHVKSSGMPWYAQLEYLMTAKPTEWHKGIFLTPAVSWVLLPLAVLGWWRTWRMRPVFAAWAVVGLAFLLVWPTKWPQYLLLVLPALAVCAGHGLGQLWAWVPKQRATPAGGGVA